MNSIRFRDSRHAPTGFSSRAAHVRVQVRTRAQAAQIAPGGGFNCMPCARICASVCMNVRARPQRAESHCGYHLGHLIAPLVMAPNIKCFLRQLCSNGDRLFSSAHIAASKSLQLQEGSGKKGRGRGRMDKSKPPLYCDKIFPHKSSCTFKLGNKELLI